MDPLTLASLASTFLPFLMPQRSAQVVVQQASPAAISWVPIILAGVGVLVLAVLL